MKNINSKTQAFDFSNVKVERDIIKGRQEPLPVSDLSGKGILDGSNNRSKMNYQNN